MVSPPAPPPPPPFPESLGDRFRDPVLLGQGAFGAVYRAVRRSDGAPVACKLLREELLRDPKLRGRFQREAVAAAQVSSPHVARVLDYGESSGIPYLLMEFVEGSGLDRLREGGIPLDRARLLDLWEQLLRGLEAVHAAGVLHRDLKPENVLLGPGDRVVLADFGFAHQLDAATLTATGEIFGTLPYMSPEQMEGREPGPHWDLYAAGVILWELLARCLPWPGGSFAELYDAKRRGPPPSPAKYGAEVPVWLEDLLRRLLSPEPDPALGSAASLLEILEVNRRAPPAGATRALPALPREESGSAETMLRSGPTQVQVLPGSGPGKARGPEAGETGGTRAARGLDARGPVPPHPPGPLPLPARNLRFLLPALVLAVVLGFSWLGGAPPVPEEALPVPDHSQPLRIEVEASLRRLAEDLAEDRAVGALLGVEAARPVTLGTLVRNAGRGSEIATLWAQARRRFRTEVLRGGLPERIGELLAVSPRPRLEHAALQALAWLVRLEMWFTRTRVPSGSKPPAPLYDDGGGDEGRPEPHAPDSGLRLLLDRAGFRVRPEPRLVGYHLQLPSGRLPALSVLAGTGRRWKVLRALEELFHPETGEYHDLLRGSYPAGQGFYEATESSELDFANKYLGSPNRSREHQAALSVDLVPEPVAGDLVLAMVLRDWPPEVVLLLEFLDASGKLLLALPARVPDPLPLRPERPGGRFPGGPDVLPDQGLTLRLDRGAVPPGFTTLRVRAQGFLELSDPDTTCGLLEVLQLLEGDPPLSLGDRVAPVERGGTGWLEELRDAVESHEAIRPVLHLESNTASEENILLWQQAWEAFQELVREFDPGPRLAALRGQPLPLRGFQALSDLVLVERLLSRSQLPGQEQLSWTRTPDPGFGELHREGVRVELLELIHGPSIPDSDEREARFLEGLATGGRRWEYLRRWGDRSMVTLGPEVNCHLHRLNYAGRPFLFPLEAVERHGGAGLLIDAFGSHKQAPQRRQSPHALLLPLAPRESPELALALSVYYWQPTLQGRLGFLDSQGRLLLELTFDPPPEEVVAGGNLATRELNRQGTLLQVAPWLVPPGAHQLRFRALGIQAVGNSYDDVGFEDVLQLVEGSLAGVP